MKSKRNSLHLENLENRELFAVTVQVVDGDLMVTGDGGNDQIEMSRQSNGAIRVQGLNGTKVNGVNYVDRFFNDDLYVHLGNGKNSLIFLGSNGGITADFIDIKMGSGNDSLVVYRLTALDDFFADMGEGDDYVYLNHLTATNRVKGSGDNGINVYTRGGTDTVLIFNTWSGEDVTVILDSSLPGATGYADVLQMDNVTALDDVWLYGFGGNDKMYLNRLYVSDVLSVDMGAGNDFMKLTNSAAKKFSTHGGTGTDKMQYYNNSYITWSYTGWESYLNRA